MLSVPVLGLSSPRRILRRVVFPHPDGPIIPIVWFFSIVNVMFEKIFFGDVPRNPTGKIEKPKLRRIYAEDKRKDIKKLLR